METKSVHSSSEGEHKKFAFHTIDVLCRLQLSAALQAMKKLNSFFPEDLVANYVLQDYMKYFKVSILYNIGKRMLDSREKESTLRAVEGG